MKRDVKIRAEEISRDAGELTNIHLQSAVYPGLPENSMYAMWPSIV